MSITQIPKFEKQNGLCINVFELENDSLRPVYINTENYQKTQIDLMLYKNHYCLITNLPRLLTDNNHLNFVCRRCLNVFISPQVLNSHIEMCQNQQACKIDFPKNDYLFFKSFQTKIDIPIRVYADFECFNIPIDEYVSDKTKILFKHEPISVAYYLISPWFEGYKCFSGRGCVKLFVQEIFEIEKMAGLYYTTCIPLLMTEQNEFDFNNSDMCWLCDKKFLKCQLYENCKQK